MGLNWIKSQSSDILGVFDESGTNVAKCCGKIEWEESCNCYEVPG